MTDGVACSFGVVNEVLGADGFSGVPFRFIDASS